MTTANKVDLERATFAGGCFWCGETLFKRLNGVAQVVSGYAGASDKAPSYEQVCSGNSGFAEAVQIEFDPKVISFDKLLEVFWAVHDPTTLNRQGGDIGSQYRSAIFYSSPAQKTAAEQSISKLTDAGKFKDPIVTAVEPLVNFFPAEEYHRDFYDRNRTNGYCRLVIDPKIQKLYKNFGTDLKPETNA